MTNEKKSISLDEFVEKHFYFSSLIWWIVLFTTLVLLSLNSISQFSELKSLISEHIFSLLLIILVAPFVLKLYVTHAKLVQIKKEISTLDFNEKKRAIETLRTESSFRESFIQKVHTTSQEIATFVAEDLKEDTQWAAQALREAAILGGALSIFGQRIHHFRLEKEALAFNFFDFLIRRIQFLADKLNNQGRIIVLLDSGTTILPFFELFAKAAVKDKLAGRNNWYIHTDLVTNNIPGISELIKNGRCNPNDRFDEIAIRCIVLPGTPLAVYSAIVGAQTVDTITKIKNENDYVIGLTTGNFVLLDGTCIRPLARGEGHNEIKSALCKVSDEVYVIASLGKLIMASSVAEFNQDLNFTTDAGNKNMQPYREVECCNVLKTKLVTTTRESSESIMRTFSEKVRDRIFKVDPHIIVKNLGEDQDYSTATDVKDIPHFTLKFDELPPTRYEQELVELPHDYMRSPEIMSKYFFIR